MPKEILSRFELNNIKLGPRRNCTFCQILRISFMIEGFFVVRLKNRVIFYIKNASSSTKSCFMTFNCLQNCTFWGENLGCLLYVERECNISSDNGENLKVVCRHILSYSATPFAMSATVTDVPTENITPTKTHMHACAPVAGKLCQKCLAIFRNRQSLFSETILSNLCAMHSQVLGP